MRSLLKYKKSATVFKVKLIICLFDLFKVNFIKVQPMNYIMPFTKILINKFLFSDFLQKSLYLKNHFSFIVSDVTSVYQSNFNKRILITFIKLPLIFFDFKYNTVNKGKKNQKTIYRHSSINEENSIKLWFLINFLRTKISLQ